MPHMPQQAPSRRTLNGRNLISRAGLAALTGLSVDHLKTLWTARTRNHHPAPVDHIGRTYYYDQDEWQRWYNQLTQQRRERLTPAATGGNPHELLTMAQVARRLGYANGDVIRSYLNQRPGYFPEPDSHARMPNGRDRPLWLAATVDEFNRGRGHRRPTGRPPTNTNPT